MEKIVIYGAGGLGREVKMLIEQINSAAPRWEFAGFIADILPKNEAVAAQVIGDVDYLNQQQEALHVVVAAGTPAALQTMVGKINNPHIVFPTLVHPAVYLHPTWQLGEGNIVAMGCKFTIEGKTGNFNVFNLGATVAHDARIGSFNVFGPNTQVSGNVTIGDNNLFGVNSAVLEKITIGNGCTIGASSLLVKDTEDGNTYFGVPAFSLRKKTTT